MTKKYEKYRQKKKKKKQEKQMNFKMSEYAKSEDFTSLNDQKGNS